MNRILWTQKQDIGPSPRLRSTMAYDSGRGRTVLFSGSGALNFEDTWEWDGANWTQMADSGPSARFGSAMAYDAERRQTVLFSGSRIPPDTWGWDGTNWTQLADNGPPARDRSAMAYDSKRQRTVLFGGAGAAGALSDTWAWGGAAWTQLAETGPSGRFDHSMAYDSIRDRMVLFGGETMGVILGDTWEWDGAVWKQVSSFGAQPCQAAAVAFKGDSVALFGGSNNADNLNAGVNGLTSTWDGQYWTPRQDFGPAPRFGHAMCYDSKRASLVVFGGASGSGVILGDTWELSEG